MSAPDLSAGSALRASRRSVEAAPSTPSTDPSAPSGFRDLLSSMASASNRSTGPSTISVADHRPTWGKEMSRVVGTPDEKSDGGDSGLPGLFGSQSDSSAGAEDQSSVVQLPDAPPSLDATSMAMREGAMSTSTLLGATPLPPTARAGMRLSQASPGGQDAVAVQLASTGDELNSGGNGWRFASAQRRDAPRRAGAGCFRLVADPDRGRPLVEGRGARHAGGHQRRCSLGPARVHTCPGDAYRSGGAATAGAGHPRRCEPCGCVRRQHGAWAKRRAGRYRATSRTRGRPMG